METQGNVAILADVGLGVLQGAEHVFAAVGKPHMHGLDTNITGIRRVLRSGLGSVVTFVSLQPHPCSSALEYALRGRHHEGKSLRVGNTYHLPPSCESKPSIPISLFPSLYFPAN